MAGAAAGMGGAVNTPLEAHPADRGKARASVLRVALVGCGERGEGCSTAIARTGNMRLSMTMDADPVRAEDLAKRFDVPWTTHFDELLASDRVDAVVICTPHHLHAAQCVAAASAGKHVIVEKPIATSLEDAVTVVEAARRAGVHLSVNLSYRYFAHVQEARSLIHAGALGELYGASLVFQTERFADYWEGHTGRTASDWRMRREASGGGVLINMLFHHLDLMRFLPGEEIAEVACAHATLEAPGEVEDSIVLWVRYERGAIGTVNASTCVRGADVVEFRLWGRDGHLSLTPPFQFYSLRVVDGRRPGRWHALAERRGVRQRDVEYFERTAGCILRGDPPEVTASDGLAVQALIDAAYRSAETAQVVRVRGGPWTGATS